MAAELPSSLLLRKISVLLPTVIIVWGTVAALLARRTIRYDLISMYYISPFPKIRNMAHRSGHCEGVSWHCTSLLPLHPTTLAVKVTMVQRFSPPFSSLFKRLPILALKALFAGDVRIFFTASPDCGIAIPPPLTFPTS